MADELEVAVPGSEVTVETFVGGEPVAPVVPEVPAAPVVEQPELRYEYQPTDEEGRNIGGRQVILYRTQGELAEKLRDQSISVLRQLRKVTRKQRLGIVDELPAGLEKVAPAPSMERKPLTAEERYMLSQDINDPEKFEEARDKLLASAGYNEMRDAVQSLTLSQKQIEAQMSAQTFINTHPEFYFCSENMEVIVDWMIKNGLNPTTKNFEVAHETMKEAGLLLTSPIVREEALPAAVPAVVPENTSANPQPTVEQDARISVDEQPQVKRQAQVPSGLNSRIASNTGAPLPQVGALTLADIDKMPSTEYGKRIKTDPEFVKLVNDLESKRPPRPRRA